MTGSRSIMFNVTNSSQSASRRQSRESAGQVFLKYFSLFCLFYMIAFPKGGLKIENIPITIGYLMTVPLTAISMISMINSKFSIYRTMCIALCIMLTIWSYLSYSRFGGQSTGFVLAYFLSIIYIPLFCLIFFSEINLGRWNSSFEKCFKFAIRFVAVYAIFLFLYKNITGSWIEIPYVTVNSQDVGSLDQKHINRDGVFKAISTYNNGNILGVCLVMMMPLYNRIEKNNILKGIFLVSLIMTLSRTVWIGLIIAIILISISNGLKAIQIFYVMLLALFVGFSIYGTVLFLGFDSSFLIDQKLGGRLSQLSYLNDASFLPNKAGVDLPEIVYLGIIHNYGYAGLLLFCLTLMSPVLAMRALGVKLFSMRPASACMQGLCIYMIIAGSDAAFNFIPTMMVFWMIGAWGLWYAEPSLRQPSYRIAPAR
jgi:hypothetical protein